MKNKRLANNDKIDYCMRESMRLNSSKYINDKCTHYVYSCLMLCYDLYNDEMHKLIEFIWLHNGYSNDNANILYRNIWCLLFANVNNLHTLFEYFEYIKVSENFLFNELTKYQDYEFVFYISKEFNSMVNNKRAIERNIFICKNSAGDIKESSNYLYLKSAIDEMVYTHLVSEHQVDNILNMASLFIDIDICSYVTFIRNIAKRNILLQENYEFIFDIMIEYINQSERNMEEIILDLCKWSNIINPKLIYDSFDNRRLSYIINQIKDVNTVKHKTHEVSLFEQIINSIWNSLSSFKVILITK